MVDIKKFFDNINPIRKINNLRAELGDVKKQLNVYQTAVLGDNTRPSNSLAMYDERYFQYSPLQLTPFYIYAKKIDLLSTIVRALRREAFRNGFEVVAAENTDNDITVSDEERDVDEKERQKLLEQLENLNENEQNLKQICEELEDDFNIADNAYLFFRYDYSFNKKGEIVNKEFVEALRVDPRLMSPVLNTQDLPGRDDNGNILMSDVEDRSQLFHIKPSEKSKAVNPRTGNKLKQVWYEHNSGDSKIYYFKDEIVHKSRYHPSKRGGTSPIYSCYKKLMISDAQDEYILQLYQGKRPPKGILGVTTSNMDSFEKSWDKLLKRAKENPHIPGVLGIESGDNGGGKGNLQFIDFMRSLDEMQFTQFREEIRRVVGAVYGVLPIWHGDISTSGGLNNEGLQITVTDRALESNQRDYNEGFLPRIVKALGYDGWNVRFRPSEEQDETAVLDRQTKMLQNAQLASQLGLKVEYDSNKGDISIESGDVTAPAQGGFDMNPESTDANSEGGLNPVQGSPVGKSEGFKKKKVGVYKASGEISSDDQLKKDIKNDVLSFLKGKKASDLSKEDLQKLRESIEGKLADKLNRKTKKLMKNTYQKTLEDVEKEQDMNFTMDKSDKQAVEALANSKVLSDSYKGLSQDVAEKINDVITLAYTEPEGLNAKKVEETIKEVSGLASNRAELIARTETGKVAASARKNSYDKLESDGIKMKYFHVGPDDSRTVDVSKRIKRRTRDGVSWDEYVRIVKEESAKDFPEWTVREDAPQSHYQSRHIFVARRA